MKEELIKVLVDNDGENKILQDHIEKAFESDKLRYYLILDQQDYD